MQQEQPAGTSQICPEEQFQHKRWTTRPVWLTNHNFCSKLSPQEEKQVSEVCCTVVTYCTHKTTVAGLKTLRRKRRKWCVMLKLPWRLTWDLNTPGSLSLQYLWNNRYLVPTLNQQSFLISVHHNQTGKICYFLLLFYTSWFRVTSMRPCKPFHPHRSETSTKV